MSITTLTIIIAAIIIAIIAIVSLILYIVGFRLTEVNFKLPFPEAKLVREPGDKANTATTPSTDVEQVHRPSFSGTSSSVPPNTQQQPAIPLTKSQRRRLEQEKQDLLNHIGILSEKISALRRDLALETRRNEQLRLQAAIEDNEKLRTEFETKLDDIESQLE